MPDHSAHHAPKPPIAIIGIGCRFPGGVTGPDSYWRLLSDGVDATRDLPPGRWDVDKFYDPEPGKSGKMGTFHGGFLERIDEFDAQFFGISPREAIWLDPQQRMLLQVAWEALEDAGQVAERLAGSDTGVFVGGFTLDYQLLQNYGVYSRYQLQSHSATGMMMTMLANRLSYFFDFRGPSMAIDTACSASLVATHLAVQSIWNGECALALAGGSNVMIAPNMTIAESKGGFLSPDGRCKTFDASANGYARGEGAAVVLLKLLDRALADRDPIYALIRGTAVTQDGHTTGITVPNQVAQERAMRRAYRIAGLLPSQVQYVEAHGTGTSVGDPIEARAIGSVMSAGRPRPAVPDRIGEDQHRPPRGGRRSCRPDQDGPCAQARLDPAAPAPARAQPGHPLRRAAAAGAHRARGMASRRGPAVRRGQLLRLRRYQRPRRPAGSPRARRPARAERIRARRARA